MNAIETVVVEPDVARIAEGLRDTGYEFNTAVADIIDNSIAAGATLVDVRAGVDFNGDIIVSVADDGHGMDRDGLIEAMKYGSKKRNDPASLGKFGLGLKTASTAFSRRLVVVSRPSVDAEPLRAAWDLDLLAESGSWKLELAKPSPDEVSVLDAAAPGKSGTAVIWYRVDRLLGEYKTGPTGKAFKNALKRNIDRLRDHISLVYQRFLDANDERAANVVIKVNGVEVEPWDPFFVAVTKEPVAQEKLKVALPDGKQANFLVRAFILPRKEELASEEERQAARISNELQGIYIYRENRLIHGPDWLQMFRQEPHFSLIRVELSFDHRLDEAFQVDIKKSRISMNSTLYDWLRDKFLAGPRREAETRYRKGQAAVAKGVGILLHTASNNTIQAKSKALQTASVTSVDEQSGSVQLTNNTGQAHAKLRIVTPESPMFANVTTEPNLIDGVLWEPAVLQQKPGVVLNAGHPFYFKAYLPNKVNAPMVQALDFLLWALAQAELNNVNQVNSEAFQEFRIEVSRNLKKLVADLPDPPEGTESA